MAAGHRARLARFALPVLVAASLPVTAPPLASRAGLTATVQVDAASNLGPVSPLLLGQNVDWPGADNTADNSVNGAFYPKTMNVLQPLQVPFVRYPGGLLANCFDWTQSITQYGTLGAPIARGKMPFYNFGVGNCDNQSGAPIDHFGTDEFMAELAAMANPRPEAEITVNVCSTTVTSDQHPTSACAVAGGKNGKGTTLCPVPNATLPPTQATCPGALDAANWVAYLNGTDQTNQWVMARIRNRGGITDPYNVHYFELGNEVNFLPASVYENIVKVYVPAMRAASPGIPIKIGVVSDDRWNGYLASQKDASNHNLIDFLIPHVYAPGADNLSVLLTAPADGIRAQSWSFTVPTTGQWTLQAFVSPDCSRVTPYVDGTALVNPTTKRTWYYGYECVWTGNQLAAAPATHRLIFAVTQAINLSTVQLCAAADTACAGPVSVDLDQYADNPSAVAVLRQGQPPWTIGSLPANLGTPLTGGLTVHLRAFANPVLTKVSSVTVAKCPTLVVKVPGAPQQTVSLQMGTGACYSLTSPLSSDLVFATTQSVSQVTFSYQNPVTGTLNDADILDASVTGAGGTTQPLDLSWYAATYPGVHVATDNEFYAASAAMGGYLDGVLGAIPAAQRGAIGVLASEWNSVGPNFAPASGFQTESLRGLLTDALLLQQMEARNLIGANMYAFDGDINWHIFHCRDNREYDDAGDCSPQSTYQPYLSLQGWMFAMLNGHLGSTRLSAGVTGPTVAVPPIVTSDYSVQQLAQTLPLVSAVATLRPGWVDVQLVNVSPDAGGVAVQLNVANATVGAGATLRYLSGDPDAVDSCRYVYSYPNVPPCASTPTAVTPATGSVTQSGGQVTFTLPPSSFSVLSIPVS